MLNQPKSKYLSLLVAAMGILFVAGCQQQPVVPAAQRFASEQGVNVEAFVPADTFLFAKVGTNDQGQLDILKVLNGYFPGDPAGAMMTQFNDGFKEGAKLDQIGLDYQKDVLPILNNKSQFFFGIAPGQGDEKLKADFYLAMTIADQGKFDAILAKEVQQNYLKQEDYNGQAIYSEVTPGSTPAFLTRYLDVVLLTSNEVALKAGLDSVKANKDSFADNVNFKKAMADYKSNLAVVYGNLPELMDVLGASEGKSSADMAKALAGTDASNIQSEVLTLTAEKDGLRLSTKVIAKDGVDFTQSQVAGNMPIYLNKKIPAANPIIYLEGSGLKSSYETMLKSLSTDPDFAKSMQEMKDYLASQQLDFEKDVLTIMDKGVAFVLDDTGTPIPSIGVYLDTSSNPAGAQKIADHLNKGFESVLADAEKQSPDLSAVITKEEVTPGKLWKLKVNLDLLLTQVPSTMAQKLTGQKVEFYYGLMDDGVMVMALKPDLEKVYGKDQTVEKSGEFAAALKTVSGEYRGVFYLAPAQVIALMDGYQKLISDSTGQSSIPEYEAVRPDIMPIKSLIFSGGNVQKDQITADFFLHIAQ